MSESKKDKKINLSTVFALIIAIIKFISKVVVPLLDGSEETEPDYDLK